MFVHSKTLLALIAATGMASSLMAADDSFSFVRASFGTVPGAKEVTFEATILGFGPVTETDKLDAKSGVNLEIGFQQIKQFGDGGLGWGYYLGGQYRTGEGQIVGGTDTVKNSTIGVSLGLDLAYKIGKDTPVFLTAGPRMGVGITQQKIETQDNSFKDAGGVLVSFGLQAGGYVNIDHFVIGAELGYQSWASTATHDYDDGSNSGTIDAKVKGSGTTFGVVLGYSF